MPKYDVLTSWRAGDWSMCWATNRGYVTVEADNPEEARRKAIEAVYAKDPENVNHVNVGRPTEIID